MKQKTGFTLVELLIAVSIFSIIILSLFSAFQTGILSYKKIDSAFEVFQTARLILNRIEKDLKNTFIYYADDSKFIGNSKAMDFYSIIDIFDNEGNMNGVVCRIKYELAQEGLKRYCYKGIDALLENTGIGADILSSKIKEISFKYAYPGTTPDKIYEWQEEPWPIDENQKKALPLAVKIELTLKDNNEVFTKIVPIPLAYLNK